MKSATPALRRVAIVSALVWAILVSAVRADDFVVAVSTANENYTRRKFGDGEPRRETFVVLQGRYYPGLFVDRSLERMPFREVVSYLTPRLAKQNFLPATSLLTADLLLVVHWGATNPRVGTSVLSGQTTWKSGAATEPRAADSRQSPLAAFGDRIAGLPPAQTDPTGGAGVNDSELLIRYGGAEERYQEFQRIGEADANDASQSDLAVLLGYTDALRTLRRRPFSSTEEQSLREDLSTERYFVIVKAYDLREVDSHRRPRPVWVVHLNISSPGNNFRTAMGRMSKVATHYFGRPSNGVESTSARLPEGRVEFGDLIILGEVK